LENIIDRDFERLDQSFYDYLAQRMADAVKQCENRVPVVTGKRRFFFLKKILISSKVSLVLFLEVC
jgi:hypothetical protein